MDLNKKLPLVSIGIPTYNNPDGLRNTLNYISNQTYRNIEIVISDNGSPGDETKKVALEFSKKDKRIKYFRQKKNEGSIFNFKFVLDKAKGEYFMWAADDDFWDKTFVEKCMNKFLNDSSLGLVLTKYKIISIKDHSFSDYIPKMNYHFCPDLTREERIALYILIDSNTSHKTNMIYGLWKKKSLKQSMEIHSYLCDKFQIKSLEAFGTLFDEPWMVYALTQDEARQVPELLFIKQYKTFAPGSLKCNVMRTRDQFTSLINPFNFKQTVNHYKKIYARNSLDVDIIGGSLEKGGFNTKKLRRIIKLKKALLIIPSEIRTIICEIIIRFLFVYYLIKKKISG
ncbi:MAG: glycosyltransferase family 2 protein [archaeon]|nr:glycosyltransferase family 2 protein [archaeon]